LLIDEKIEVDFELIPYVVYDMYFRSNRDGQFDIYRMNSNGEDLTRIMVTGSISMFKFTADGSYIFYQKSTGGLYDIYKMNSDRTGKQKLTNLSAERISWDVSPDGQKLSYSSDKGNYDHMDSLIVINFQLAQIDIYTHSDPIGLDFWYNCFFLWNGADIFRMDIYGGNFRQLTASPATDCDPVFQPTSDLFTKQ
jgi:Tol biopolymer transport system component